MLTGNVFKIPLFVFINGLFFVLTCLSPSVHASGPEGLSIDDIHIDRGEYERLLMGIPMSIDPEMMEKAKQAIPGDISERVEKERSKLIEREFYGMDAAGVVPGNNQGQAGNTRHGTAILKEDERIYIFVSSSVPKDTLRNYARDLDRLGQPRMSIVMRGFVGGMTKVRPTLEFLRGVLFKDETCDYDKCEAYRAPALIDPLLFRRYGIEAVPAIVYAKGVRVVNFTVSEGLGEGAETGDYYILYGDAALEGALELINSEARSRSLDCLVWKLRRGEGYERDCK
ncbi:MAG: hypothetical protein IT362_11810 [Deltaproteobacteria bacterium]|nr:hypothetical protein [Deltaproteobacteria bacterium]